MYKLRNSHSFEFRNKIKRKASLPLKLDPKFEQKGAERKASWKVVTKQPSEKQLKDAMNMGVPKFLVNKWLNVGWTKSKFVQKSWQIDNEDDVSKTSDWSRSSVSQLDNSNVIDM